MQTAESRVGEGSDSPTARACKTGMQKLRGLFIKGSKGRMRGDGNDEEAMAVKRGTLEYNEEEEAKEEISDLPEINRSGSKPFGSGWGPASPATPRGLLGGAQPVARDASLELHAPPEWVVTYVRLLRGRPLRWFFLLLWLSLTLSGASIYFPLTRILKISVEPPYGSESEAAKITYAENFPPEPVTLVALLSTNQRNAPNQTLINADAEMQLELLPPFFSYNPEGDLTAETESISLDLKKRVQPYLELVEWPAAPASGAERASGVPAPPPSPAELKPKCEFNFYSFFDMPFEVQMVAHSFLFPSNFGGQEGMIAVHLVSCYGHAIYKECVYKHEWFCEPVAELLESWANYREWRMEEFPESPVAPRPSRRRPVMEVGALTVRRALARCVGGPDVCLVPRRVRGHHHGDRVGDGALDRRHHPRLHRARHYVAQHPAARPGRLQHPDRDRHNPPYHVPRLVLRHGRQRVRARDARGGGPRHVHRLLPLPPHALQRGAPRRPLDHAVARDRPRHSGTHHRRLWRHPRPLLHLHARASNLHHHLHGGRRRDSGAAVCARLALAHARASAHHAPLLHRRPLARAEPRRHALRHVPPCVERHGGAVRRDDRPPHHHREPDAQEGVDLGAPRPLLAARRAGHVPLPRAGDGSVRDGAHALLVRRGPDAAHADHTPGHQCLHLHLQHLRAGPYYASAAADHGAVAKGDGEPRVVAGDLPHAAEPRHEGDGPDARGGARLHHDGGRLQRADDLPRRLPRRRAQVRRDRRDARGAHVRHVRHGGRPALEPQPDGDAGLRALPG
mmetsp:Transcript_37184/g.124563  ORF Transcript_37184/g.124563 Transcript_37184/m.124563 type:complete len:794 (-) Transcript_37184:1308-3689(-)